MVKEFREFIARGNVVDMAVGIIIGAAFTAIVQSLVNDVIMPPIGVITGGVDFSNLFITLSGGPFASLAEAQEAGAATINYGVFINNILIFLVVAYAVFLLVKAINRMRRQVEKEKEAEAAAPAEPPPPPRQEVLLEEIRDLLKAK